MANQLTKAYKEYPQGTVIKIKRIEDGMVIITIPSSPTPTKKLMLPISFVGRKPVSTPQEVQQTFLNTTKVSPGQPSIASYDWSKLDAMPITYSAKPEDFPVRVECYCGKSFEWYRRVDIDTQAKERMAVDKAIASCTACAERHSNSSQKSEVVS